MLYVYAMRPVGYDAGIVMQLERNRNASEIGGQAASPEPVERHELRVEFLL